MIVPDFHGLYILACFIGLFIAWRVRKENFKIAVLIISSISPLGPAVFLFFIFFAASKSPGFVNGIMFSGLVVDFSQWHIGLGGKRDPIIFSCFSPVCVTWDP